MEGQLKETGATTEGEHRIQVYSERDKKRYNSKACQHVFIETRTQKVLN